ncbi:MAG TPA: type II toxin-antitoxin system RelE/ParE family toxin [Mucilaginibacter sp.]|nr:type II toxin-antitoxin system RelE/ParE family toxin [Mucilaginibacter sp.]
MYQLVIKPKAIEMAKEAYEWYNEQQAGLGDLFLDELEGYYDKLEELPLAYSKIKKNFRQAVLHKFPYVIVFEIIKKEVVIYSIFHTSRNPRKKFIRG